MSSRHILLFDLEPESWGESGFTRCVGGAGQQECHGKTIASSHPSKKLPVVCSFWSAWQLLTVRLEETPSRALNCTLKPVGASGEFFQYQPCWHIINLKCTGMWFLVYPQSCAAITTISFRTSCTQKKVLSRWLGGKENTCQCRRLRFDPWFSKMPWRRKWQPTPVFLPGRFHGQRSLAGYSPCRVCFPGDRRMTIPFLRFSVWPAKGKAVTLLRSQPLSAQASPAGQSLPSGLCCHLPLVLVWASGPA